MKFRNIVLLLAAGLSTGVVMAAAFARYGSRTFNYGGELFFIPMVGLLVWLGWMLHGEIKKIKHGRKKTSFVGAHGRMTLGDSVETTTGVKGILVDIRISPQGEMAYIATTDGRTYYCFTSYIK